MKHRKKRNTKSRVPQRKALAWSSHQEAIFKEIRDGKGHGVVLASPGSGKSTTIVEAIHQCPKENNLCLAFNKSIADNLIYQVPLGTSAKTFHKLGFETVRANWSDIGGRSIDMRDEAQLELAGKLIGVSYKFLRLRENLVQAVKMSKTMLADTVDEIDSVCAQFGISTCGIDAKDFSGITKKMMDASRNQPLVLNGEKVISFDDMLWLPYVHGWKPKTFDRIFVDEAQDLSAARTNLVMNALSDDGRLFCVGDKNQAIYGFAGATPGVIDTVINELKARCMPLSVSYRCPKRIVALAQEINPDIEAAQNAEEGAINHIEPKDLAGSLNGNSAILSRNNFTLISTAFSLVKAGVRANIIGKDIGNRFSWRIDCWEPSSITDLQKSIEGWRSELGQRLLEQGGNTDRLNDEADSIKAFADESTSVAEVQSNIKKFFDEKNKSQIKLSTTHKAKGLEWDHVYMLEKTFKPGKNQEEDNINYVAITRAKKSLTFVR